jgi:hypothetical protein
MQLYLMKMDITLQFYENTAITDDNYNGPAEQVKLLIHHRRSLHRSRTGRGGRGGRGAEGDGEGINRITKKYL